MAFFSVTLTDDSTERVAGADAYQQEGPLTTFFALAENRQVIDSWSVRLASFRTSDIVKVRRGKQSEDMCASSSGSPTNSDVEPQLLLRSA